MARPGPRRRSSIRIEGARQNNLKNIDVEFPLGELTVVTGVSGSGKSSLAFDTLYAEGHRRYVETFSPYARQFLDRMDKPACDGVKGIPPAIAIDRTDPVRTSRSTVGTMTEINDFLKHLYAHLAQLWCPQCGERVERDSSPSIVAALREEADGRKVVIGFPVPVPEGLDAETVRTGLRAKGYRRVMEGGRAVSIDDATLAPEDGAVLVALDRVTVSRGNRTRIVDALDASLRERASRGRVDVHLLGDDGSAEDTLHFSTGLHCAGCDRYFAEPTPNHFSFNSPIGACETCRGFGRTIALDMDLVIPDDSLSLAECPIRPWQSGVGAECHRDMMLWARKAKVPTNKAFAKLPAKVRRAVIEGTAPGVEPRFYGVRGYFAYLEARTYKMHVRVLLSRYRKYDVCETCDGARLKPEPLCWRLEGANIHELQSLPIGAALGSLEQIYGRNEGDEAARAVLGEVLSRLRYLVDVGLGYLTLDRQSRTLSGGEVERVNLTTALGSTLTSTLYVLDEPSIGLHPRDVGRLSEVLEGLRNKGNTVVVVEHDPEIIRRADNIVDIGPGPGASGGQVVYAGRAAGITRSAKSLTGRYLTGRAQVEGPSERRALNGQSRLVVRGASENNLKALDLEVPLGMFLCITGVSGSGKSTLVEQVLHRNLVRTLARRRRKPTGDKPDPQLPPGRCEALEIPEELEGVVLVDQSPLGRTPRANSLTYLKAWGPVRKAFAAQPRARALSLEARDFSFNAGIGRCERCGGDGYERVEMQFLSDIYLDCPECGGQRFGPAALSVKIDGRSIADVLELSAYEAMDVLGELSGVTKALQPLIDVGLGYLKLGQPLNTLSGGEAQRLKLAGRLQAGALKLGRSGRPKEGRLLFVFDEPTTGLHLDDVRVLVGVLQRLVDAGHSVLCIEHNIDVIKCADRVIDLGPEGGEGGGRIVAEGSPEEVAAVAGSHTGRALAEALGHEGYAITQAELPEAAEPRAAYDAGLQAEQERAAQRQEIVVTGAREHNLKDVDITVPLGRLIVVTGLSGSGKSTFAFDLLFAEGQRRYMDSLSAWVRQQVGQLARPDVQRITGLPPTVAIEQRISRGGRNSTVATVTEVYHFLRLLFAKLGVAHCPEHDAPIEPLTRVGLDARIAESFDGRRPLRVLAPLVRGRKGIYRELFEELAKKGFERVEVDGALMDLEPTPRIERHREHDILVEVGRDKRGSEAFSDAVTRALELGSGVVVIQDSRGKEATFSTQRACPECGRGFEELDPRLFSFNSRQGWCPSCKGTGTRGEARRCGSCDGTRLNDEARSVLLQGTDIGAVCQLPSLEARRWAAGLRFTKRDRAIAESLVPEIVDRLAFLEALGLDYLSLDRRAHTLSAGESQRIRLAAQLGSNLRGVAYVLDEPTIGLHPRDNRLLVGTLRKLCDRGNTVMVVEHDEETIRAADHVIDIGPGSGRHGGEIVAQGTLKQLLKNKRSVTAQWLKKSAEPLESAERRETKRTHAKVWVRGARGHNLRGVDVGFPIGRFTCVTGVSGSGKSTLVQRTLRAGLQARLGVADAQKPASHRSLEGAEPIERVVEVDQTPIGRTPRSVPATYVKIWDEVRRLFAGLPDAKLRGYGTSRFSFNVAASKGGGRCEVCGGQGQIKVEMSFLPDVYLPCEECKGRRFTEDTLEITYKGASVADILEMSIEDALPFFDAVSKVKRPLQVLCDIGLGYLTLGQPSPTLSGGEAQRIKLASELAAAPTKAGRNLYVLDEPTTGLHMADVERLIGVLHRFVDRGDTVVVIEHNLDMIAAADWVIDLGPEGGPRGGKVVAQGPPEKVAQSKSSHTAVFLRERLGATSS